MRTLLAAFMALSLVAISGPLSAGVVMTQEIVTTSGANTNNETRTVMVQGNKQKVIMRSQSIVLDLDRGKMLLINPGTKTYTELPFPPTGPMASMMHSVGGVDLDFKKTGASKTMAGYKCQEYDSTGKSMMGEFSAKGCFSMDAPGAEEYTAFTKDLAKKFKEAGMTKTSGNHPDGIPLVLDTTTKMTNFSMPGLTPEQAERIKQMMANRPPTNSKSTTTNIKTAKLSDDTFTVPAGYKERKIEMPFGRGPGMRGAPAPAAQPTPYEGE
jgi:Domain of unknown function (DUF4412)